MNKKIEGVMATQPGSLPPDLDWLVERYVDSDDPVKDTLQKLNEGLHGKGNASAHKP